MPAGRDLARVAGLAAGLGLVVAAAGQPAGSHAPVTPSRDSQRADAQAGVPAFDAARAWEHVRQLVAIGPRPAGSPALREARAYLTRQLSSLGFTVEDQTFTAASPLGPVGMTNLIVTLPGQRKDRLLIGGHYDTKLSSTQTLVGANDGASGAALLVELARVLKERPHEFTYEVVWFDGEEAVGDGTGLDHTYGSRFYVQAAQQARAVASLKAMILVNMIGAANLEIRRDGNSTAWLTDVIWSTAARLGDERVFVDQTTIVEDDHEPFVAAGVPAVALVGLDDPRRHTAADDLTHVSAPSLQAVGDVLLAALPDIETRLGRSGDFESSAIRSLRGFRFP